MIETGLRTLLLAQSSITTIAVPQIIDKVTYQGIFNEHPVQGFVPPFVLISMTDRDPLAHLGATSGLQFTDFDIDAYHYSHPGALALGKAIQDFFFPPGGGGDFSGAAGADDTILAVLYEGKRYDEVFEDQGRDVRQHISSLSINVQHQPSS